MEHISITALAQRQHGLVTRPQALALGATDQRLRSLVSSGAWSRVRPGVFAVGAARDTWERRVMAALLSAGPDAVSSHRTAARLWRLVERSGPIEISTTKAVRRRIPGVTAHRSTCLAEVDRTTVAGIPTTTMERTIVDLARTQSEGTLARWVDQGLRTKDLDLDRLRRCTASLQRPGRSGPGRLQRVLAERLPGYCPGDSVLEDRAMKYLRDGGLPEPVRQYRVVRPGGKVAFIDLAYPDHLVGIELDGWEFHGQRGAFDDDRMRRNDLTLGGWTILNFTSTTPASTLVATVARALGVDPA